MMIIDHALKSREADGRPLRIALVGAGFAARGVAQQLLMPLTGLRLVAIVNRTVGKAQRLFEERRLTPVRAETANQFDVAVAAGTPVVTTDIGLAARSQLVDVIVDCTGQVEYGAHVALAVIEGGKPLVMANAELDATLGPILKRKADAAGVTISNTDGDEPAVAMNLYRSVETMGFRVVMAGNIKGFLDVHRNPDTQRGFAERVGQQPAMIVSFADGTKLSFESAILANATGLAVRRRGMTGFQLKHAMELPAALSADELLLEPRVDYILGAEPGNGAFVVAHSDEPVTQQYMQYFKMGDGPLYLFYTPFHLPTIECSATIARVALFGDAAVAPAGPPVAEVIAVAKRGLSAGATLDGIGGFDCYGTIEDAHVARRGRLLPMGIASSCTLLRDVAQDEPLTYADVALPSGRLCDRLREEQDAWLEERFAQRESQPRGSRTSRPTSDATAAHAW
jgi:predicted homoserine dehydrogenase-like protein